jgi:hypothetical protein
MAMRRWLRARGFDEPVIRANRLGADPGPAKLERAKGLPRGGAAIVLPVLGADDRPTYLQARYLLPNGRRYDNPATDLVGASPRLAEARLPFPPADARVVIVCEGIPDGLTAAQAGYRSVAVLGAALPDEHLAHRLLERFPAERFVLAFDGDDSGRAGEQRLGALLDELGAGERTARLEVPTRWGDLNWWLQGAWQEFDREFDQALRDAVGGLGMVAAQPDLALVVSAPAAGVGL